MSALFKFTKPDCFNASACDFIAAHITELAASGDDVTLFLSGGSTPGPVYKALSNYPLQWDKIHTGLVDERWVNENNKGSNAALIRKTLLQNRAKNARFTPMKTPHTRAIEAQSDCEATYNGLAQQKSVAVLGMGLDGHTASWFPNAVGTEQALDPKNAHIIQPIMAIPSPVTGAYLERMTMTLTALLSCEALLLLIKGQEKFDILKTGAPNHPITALLRSTAGNLTIMFLDT